MNRPQTFLAFGLCQIHRALHAVGIGVSLYYLVRERTDCSANGPRLDSEGYTMSLFDESDIRLIGRHPDRDESLTNEALLLERLKKGNQCYGIKYNGGIAAFTWFNIKEITFPPERRTLESDEAYLFDLYTMEKYRGKGLAPIIRAEAYRSLRQQGRNRVYSISDFTNYNSIRVKKKLNAEFLHLGVCVSLFKKYHGKWALKTPACSRSA